MMKFSHYLLFLSCFFMSSLAFAQVQETAYATSFADLEAGMPIKQQQVYTAPEPMAPQPEGVTATYSDRIAFQTACAGLTLEDFNTLVVAPSQVAACGNPVNSANSCGGTLQAGFSFAASTPSANVVALGAGIFGPSPLIAADLFSDYNIIHFPNNDVFSIGMTIYIAGGPENTGVRVYGAGGALINTYTPATAGFAGTFFGITADEVITRIEIESPSGLGEVIDDLEFGTCEIPCDRGDCHSGMDIGDASGGATYHSYITPGSYTVHAAGTGIKGTADGFHFAADEETGDIDLIVQVTGIQNNASRQAGLMLRECDTDDAAHVAIVVNGKKQVKMITRPTEGASTVTIATKPARRRLGSWLRLVRTGNNIIGYYSRQGTIWEYVGITTFAPDPYAAGMVASKGATGSAKTFNFANFSHECMGPPPPPRLSNTATGLTLKGYPSPFDQQLSYQLDGLAVGEAQVRLMDMTGRVVRSETITVGEDRYEGKLETSDLTAGVYFLVVNTDQERKMTKVVKR